MKQQLQKKATKTNSHTAQAHMHIFMNGTDYKKAVADQKNWLSATGDPRASYGIPEAWNQPGCGKAGYLRNLKADDGAGACLWDSPIGRRYLPFTKRDTTERSWEEVTKPCMEYMELIGDLRRQGGHFVKIYDLRHHGLYSWMA